VAVGAVSPAVEATAAPIVALDLDGVCNDSAYVRASLAGHEAVVQWDTAVATRTLDPVRVARVQRVCDETGAAIVLVTGWRRWAPAEDIAACLRSAGLVAPVLGAVGGVKMTGDLRASGLRDWLAAHPEVTRWCVIDDTVIAWQGVRSIVRRERRDGRVVVVHDEERFAPPWLAGRCVHPHDGITDADADAAVAILLGAGAGAGAGAT
jgi:hypothetical protein